MKRLITVTAVGGLLLGSALCGVLTAQEAGGAKAPHAGGKPHMERPALTDMTVTGKITKEEKAGKDGKTFTHYVLTDAAGNKVMLSEGRGPKAEGEAASAIKLADYVDKDVTVVGKGFTMERDGNKVTRMVSITKIDVAGDAAAPAPAPAPAPAK